MYSFTKLIVHTLYGLLISIIPLLCDACNEELAEREIEVELDLSAYLDIRSCGLRSSATRQTMYIQYGEKYNAPC